jgi:5-methylcytosine-specific restriction endonuclease McrA
MKNREYKMEQLREQGLAYSEIGDIFGISRQRVFQIINENEKNRKPISVHIRKRILAGNRICSYCGYFEGVNEKDTKLVIHHIDLNPGNNSTKNLIVLCRKCHGFIHGIIGKSYAHLQNQTNVI